MKLFGLNNCDICRRALKQLRSAGHEAELIDVRKQPIAAEELARYLVVFGDALVNRRSTTWRKLSEDERKQDPIALLLAHPSLMKRPLCVEVGCAESGGLLTLGWGADEQKLWGV